MKNRALNSKEDIALIADAIRVERFCRLNFYRRVEEMRGRNFDLGEEAAGVEQEVRALLDDMTDANGALDLTFEHIERVLKAVEQTLRHYRNGELDDLSKQGDDFERLCSFLRNNLNRLRELRKHLRVTQAAIDSAAVSESKHIEPKSTILRDDILLIKRCLTIEGYHRALFEVPKVGIELAATNVEAELDDLIESNLNDNGNLHLRSHLDIMAVLDATELTLELLAPGHKSVARNASETSLLSQACSAEHQAIGRIADQLLTDLGFPPAGHPPGKLG